MSGQRRITRTIKFDTMSNTCEEELKLEVGFNNPNGTDSAWVPVDLYNKLQMKYNPEHLNYDLAVAFNKKRK